MLTPGVTVSERQRHTEFLLLIIMMIIIIISWSTIHSLANEQRSHSDYVETGVMSIGLPFAGSNMTSFSMD